MENVLARGQFSGFLINGHYDQYFGRPVLVLWIRTERGPLKAIVQEPQLVFFIGREVEDDKLKNLGQFERKKIPLKDMTYRDVDGLYFQNLKDLLDAKEKLQALGVRTYEADIRPLERFLMERFISGTLEVIGEVKETSPYIVVEQAQIRAKKDIAVPFSMLSLDIETSMKGDLLSIALSQVNHDKSGSEKNIVFMNGSMQGQVEEATPVEWLESEAQVLTRMLETIKLWDPDVISGWHVVGFDFKFLEKKATRYAIPLTMGREGDRLNIFERSGVSFASMHGRVVLDGPWAFKSNFYSFSNFKLDTVAHEVLGVGKDIDASGMAKVAEIERRYKEDRAALARYNLLDAQLVNQVVIKTGLFDLMLERSRISGLMIEKTRLSTAAFDHFFLPRLHRFGHVAPNVLDIEMDGGASGGHVFDPVPGLHDHVIVLDFKSLYPSIMRTFHIDPYSRIVAAQEVDSGENIKDILNTPAGINFSKEHHILPDFVAEMMTKRAQAKASKNSTLSQAIKILMNSFYGVMGSRGSRFHHVELPEAITGTGRWILETSKSIIEENGNKVIYGDTDSLFVQLKVGEASKAFERASELAESLNIELAKIIKTRFKTTSYLEVEFEKYFRKVFFAPLRTGEGAAKKRYAAWKWSKHELDEQTPVGEFIFSGLEVVRQDWTDVAKVYQREIYRRLFLGEDIKAWTKEFIDRIKNQEFKDELVYKKRLSKPASEYKKNIPPHVRAVLMLSQIEEFAEEANSARDVQYVMTSRGPVPIQLKPEDIDFQHYIDKQIRPLAESVLWYFDSSWDELEGGSQLDLL
ncbi:MAG: hypothetical protein CME71_05200 [Halobacteriovorax sp.]|nr:hypothetical protein [Halobacteriovorax sp.]